MSAFELVQSREIKTLNVVLEHYRHVVTGAEHFHLAASHNENVFLVGFRTVPHDSKGSAHILEHTVLCGSERFPVRDPFFMMIRRSLNTFMNAMTASDWTAYPFASQNRKDFSNLLDIYLDATFFPLLNPLDFAQEGHRLEFDDSGDLTIKGVVFNEMKGALSSPVSFLWHRVCHFLFPSTTYHFNSGGDPKVIPDLSYEELKAFHRRHYSPDNAIFMTYGDISAKEHQQVFEEKVLRHFGDEKSEPVVIGDEQRFVKPLVVEDVYPLEEKDVSKKSHIVLAWLLGHSFDSYELLKMNLLAEVLLANSASPLRHALETCGLGLSPSSLCGLEDSQREMSFICGVEGSEPEQAEAVEALVLKVLQDVAENGVPQEDVESVLHQIELHQREIGGDRYPYGMQLIFKVLSMAVHRGDAYEALDIEPVLSRLREDIQDPNFIKALVKAHLLDNVHRVRLTLKPDVSLGQKEEEAVKVRLAEVKAALSDEGKREIVAQSKALSERQESVDDMDILPKLTLDDIPLMRSFAQGQSVSGLPVDVHFYPQGTNGLVYQHVVLPLGQLSSEQLGYLPLLMSFLPEVGCGDRDYLAVQKWQDSVCGGISASVDVRSAVDDCDKLQGVFVLSSKGLSDKYDAFSELQSQLLSSVRFDELDRFRELISQQKTALEESITHHGHKLAMVAASSSLTPLAWLQHQLRGLVGIARVKQWDKDVADSSALKSLVDGLAGLYRSLVAVPYEMLVVSEAERFDGIRSALSQCWSGRSDDGFKPFVLDAFDAPRRQLWVTNTQVNFCAQAYKTVPMSHSDSPVLSVLAAFLKHGFLHRVIREQGGAYGGGATHEVGVGVFRFFSYRDPKLVETLQAFEDSLSWLRSNNHGKEQLEEAVISVIGQLDKPLSPAGEAKKAFYQDLFGRSADVLDGFRQGVLKVSFDDLLRVADVYLSADKVCQAVITNEQSVKLHGDLGMTIFTV